MTEGREVGRGLGLDDGLFRWFLFYLGLASFVALGV